MKFNDIELYYNCENNKVEIKEINFVKTENVIQEIKLGEIDSTLDNNDYNNKTLQCKSQY